MERTDVYVTALRLKDGELLIVITFHECSNALEIYSRRWETETLFRALKSGGFRFESNHLTDLERIEKLPGPVSIALVFCYLVGDRLNFQKPIPFKKHGYRAKSIFRYGYDYIRRILLNLTDQPKEFGEILRILTSNIFTNPTDSNRRYGFVR
jgi:hypothetical protein